MAVDVLMYPRLPAGRVGGGGWSRTGRRLSSREVADTLGC